MVTWESFGQVRASKLDTFVEAQLCEKYRNKIRMEMINIFTLNDI